jgi:hypothetical protein
LSRRHVYASPPWVPYTEAKTGRTFINCPSTYRDNPFIDRDAYRLQLDAATATDPELGRAWADGDWSVARGAYFSAVLDEARVLVEPWEPEALRPKFYGQAGWQLRLAHDFGVSAPSVTYVVGESPGIEGPDGRYYSRGSIVLLDELATNEPDSLDRGMGYTVPRLADEVKAFAKRWNLRPEGVADDAIFARTGSGAGSIAEEFRSQGVYWRRARKGERIAGWLKMASLLQNAGKADVAGLYVSRLCAYWWATVPTLPRDPRRSDDVDSRAADHAADACRYAILGPVPVPVATVGTFTNCR